MKKDKKKAKGNSSFGWVFLDVGIVAWICLLFGVIVLLIADWKYHQHHMIFALIALLYGLGRLKQVFDKQDILEELKEVKKLINRKSKR